MKRLLALILGIAALQPAPPAGADTLPMDADWKFSRGDFAGAERAAFDDSGWRSLDVPHDWSIEGPFDPSNPAGGAGAFLPAGIGWYRQHFSLPANLAGRRVFVEFDGVMANSDVWINGTHLGRRPYGYVGFRYELPARSLKFGADAANVLAVRCNDADQPASRWYSGAGIYRHVRLLALDPLHFDQGGIFVSTPKVSAEEALVHVQTTVVNQSDEEQEVDRGSRSRSNHRAGAALLVVALDDGPPEDCPRRRGRSFSRIMVVAHPRLWDLDQPNLYLRLGFRRRGTPRAIGSPRCRADRFRHPRRPFRRRHGFLA